MIEQTYKKGWSNSTLKIIAISTMFLDHIGAVLLEPYIVSYSFPEWLFYIDTLLRLIGRVAFPIFIFLLLEGVEHTSNRRKYGIQLGIFALIAEIPFNLAINGTWLYIGYQNVMFTLLLGYLAISIYEKDSKKEENFILEQGKATINLISLIKWLGIGLCIVIAHIGKTDYGAFGVIAIFLLYRIKKEKKSLCKFGSILFLWEITAPIAFIFISKYNGKRGLKIKYIFYWFYPVHLLLLGLVRTYLLHC